MEKMPRKIDVLYIDDSYRNIQNEISSENLNRRIQELLEKGILLINVHIPLFGFELLIQKLLQKFEDLVVFDENFNKILKYTALSQRHKKHNREQNGCNEIKIFITNQKYIYSETQSINIVEGSCGDVRNVNQNLDIISWSVLPIGPEIDRLFTILRPKVKKAVHAEYYSNCILSQSIMTPEEISREFENPSTQSNASYINIGSQSQEEFYNVSTSNVSNSDKTESNELVNSSNIQTCHKNSIIKNFLLTKCKGFEKIVENSSKFEVKPHNRHITNFLSSIPNGSKNSSVK